MTRADYEQQRASVGSWGELYPPWPVVEEHMRQQERQRADRIACALLEQVGWLLGEKE
jgi:hypothetical protein